MKNFSWKVEKTTILNDFLREVLPQATGIQPSNSKIRRLIVAGSVNVNGAQCRIPSYNLKAGSKVEAFIDLEKFLFEKKPQDLEYQLTQQDVLYEDESIILVNKPPFVPTEETIVQDRINMHKCVVDYLWKKNPSLRNPPYAGIMHRLDRETSGVLLFTKTRSVNNQIHQMFEEHTTIKTYVALCSPKAETQNKSVAPQTKITENSVFTIEKFIGRVSPKSQACKIGELPEERGGQYSKTQCRIIKRKSELTLVECRLFTGRTHQIRVHLSMCGFPLVNDTLYGGKTINRCASSLMPQQPRIMLHAKSLEFTHPVTGKNMLVKAPVPPEFTI